MVDFQYYINNDFFKIGRFGEKHVKQVNMGILGNQHFNLSNRFGSAVFLNFLRNSVFNN